MRQADKALFEALQQILGRGYVVFAKVKLSELVEPQVESGNRVHQLHWIKVHRQTVDFLLCRRGDMEPLVALRVLAKTEYARRGLGAHDVIDSVLRDINLPRIMLVEKKKYDPADLKQKIRVALAEGQGDPGRSGAAEGRRQGQPPN
jgi:hypothetical protein